MKRAVALAVLLAAAGSAAEQPARPEAELRRFAEGVFEALDRGDVQGAFAHYAEDATVIVNGEMLPWGDQVRESMDSLRALRNVRHEVEAMQVRMVGPQAAVIFGTLRFSATDASGATVSSRPAWTWVVVRRGGAWKILHAHASVPFDR